MTGVVSGVIALVVIAITGGTVSTVSVCVAVVTLPAASLPLAETPTSPASPAAGTLPLAGIAAPVSTLHAPPASTTTEYVTELLVPLSLSGSIVTVRTVPAGRSVVPEMTGVVSAVVVAEVTAIAGGVVSTTSSLLVASLILVPPRVAVAVTL